MMKALKFAYKTLKNYYFNHSSPIWLDLSLTGACNLNCIFCESGGKLTSKYDLSKCRILELIDEAAKLKIDMINIGGGEPFLRRDIWDILEYLNSKGIGANIITNGTLIDEFGQERLNVLKRILRSITVSLDSNKEEKHDYIRGKAGTYSKTISGLKKLSKLRLNVLTFTVITRYNFMDMPEIIKLASRLNLKRVMFQPLNPKSNFPGVEPKEGKETLLITGGGEIKELKEAIAKGIGMSRKIGIQTNLPLLDRWVYQYFRCQAHDGFYFEEVVREYKCFMPFASAFINYNGDVQPCAIMPKVGNIDGSSLTKEIAKFRSLKKNLKKREFPQICKNCFCQFPINLRFSAMCSPLKNTDLLGLAISDLLSISFKLVS